MTTLFKLFNRHTAGTRYPVVSTDTRESCIKCGMTASILALLIVSPAFATDPDPVAQKTVASKAYVDTKQDIITTGLVTFREPEEQIDYSVPALVSYGTGTNNADGVLGNKIGILGMNLNGGLNSWDFLDLWDDSESAYLDNFVPTVRAVANEIQRLPWNPNTHPNAINAYSTNFTDTTNNWPSDNSTKLVNGNTFANALALKQNKIAQSGKRYAADGTLASYNENSSAVSTSWLSASVKGTGLVTKTATNGVVGERKIFEASDVSNYHAANLNQNQQDIQDISIPTVGAMMTAITNSITAAAPSGTANTLANYDSTGALGTGVATYDGSTTYDSTNDASKVAIMSAVQRKKECGGYETGHENDPNYCWLWILPD